MKINTIDIDGALKKARKRLKEEETFTAAARSMVEI